MVKRLRPPDIQGKRQFQNGYSLSVGRNGEREIDFVGEKDGEKIYIQVTYSVMESKTHEREFGNLRMN